MYVCTIYSNIPVYRRDSTTPCQGSPTGLGTGRRCSTLYHTHHKATSGESQSFKKEDNTVGSLCKINKIIDLLLFSKGTCLEMVYVSKMNIKVIEVHVYIHSKQ